MKGHRARQYCTVGDDVKLSRKGASIVVRKTAWARPVARSAAIAALDNGEVTQLDCNRVRVRPARLAGTQDGLTGCAEAVLLSPLEAPWHSIIQDMQHRHTQDEHHRQEWR